MVRVRATEVTDDGRHLVEERLAAEEPLEIRLAAPGRPAERAWVTMRTPGHDFELAAGWVVHEGLAAPGDIRTVAYCTEVELTPDEVYNVVTVTLTADAGQRLAPSRHLTHASGSAACGVCGKESIAAVLTVPRGRRWVGELPDEDVIRTLPDLLRQQQPAFERTGGLHAAAAAGADGRLLVTREDIGRHNAVDKVTGARVLAGEQPAEALLVLSGRAGFELVQKAVAAGYAGIVAVGAASSLAVALGRQSGLAIWGFTRPDRVIRYC